MNKINVEIKINNDDTVTLEASDGDNTLNIELAQVAELTRDMIAPAVEAATLEAAFNQPQKDTHQPIKFARIGQHYSVFNWKRVGAGDYETKAGNGLRLKVWAPRRQEWYAQVGNAVLNENRPVTTKVEAIDLVEKVLIKD